MCLKNLFDGKGKKHQLDSEKIGDLTQLSTDAKGNLVEAVNEVNGHIPKVATDDNGKIMQVENGVWKAVEHEVPSSDDVYHQIMELLLDLAKRVEALEKNEGKPDEPASTQIFTDALGIAKLGCIRLGISHHK